MNESETITVSFSPSEIGNYDDVATVDASVFGDTSFDITGEGTQVEISLSTFNVTFDNCSVGDSSLHTVTIGNEGVGTLTVSDIISSDANFHARPRNLSISSGNSSNVTLVFKPVSTGSKSTVFTISSNDQNNATENINGSGKGVTGVSGNIGTDTWTLAESPYQTTGHVNIGSNDVLTVQPGVEIIFGGPDTMTVNGQLILEGTESDSIYISGLEIGSAIIIDNGNYTQTFNYVTMPKASLQDFGTEDFENFPYSSFTTDSYLSENGWRFTGRENWLNLSLSDGWVRAQSTVGNNWNWVDIESPWVRVTGPNPSISFDIEHDFAGDNGDNYIYAMWDGHHGYDDEFYRITRYDREWSTVHYTPSMNRPEHKKIQHFRLKIYAYAYNGVTVRLDNIVTNDLEIFNK